MVADINDKASMLKLASSTKVLLSTAGPYIQLGTPIIRACVQAKTHYADINGINTAYISCFGLLHVQQLGRQFSFCVNTMW